MAVRLTELLNPGLLTSDNLLLNRPEALLWLRPSITDDQGGNGARARFGRFGGTWELPLLADSDRR